MDTATLDKVKPVRLITGQKKDKKTQAITPVVHEVLLPSDMSIADLLEGVGGTRARSVFLQTNFRHASLHGGPVIGKEHEIVSYTSEWMTEGDVSSFAYDIAAYNPEKVAAFVEQYS